MKLGGVVKVAREKAGQDDERSEVFKERSNKNKCFALLARFYSPNPPPFKYLRNRFVSDNLDKKVIPG
jgi:hypothetical protein